MLTNIGVWDPEYVPVDLEHRNAELNALSTALDPVLSGQAPNHAMLFGPTGVGKTVSARWLLEELADTARIHATYVNCWDDHRPWDVLNALLDPVVDVTYQRRVDSVDDLQRALRHALDQPYIVILDEADRLDSLDLLYSLDRISQLGLVLIANREEELFGRLDERVQSRLASTQSVRFDPYGVGELADILEARAQAGLDPTACTRTELEHVADQAAGDARVAINSLCLAAQVADSRGQSELTTNVIDEAVPRAKAGIRQKTADRLDDHERVLYEVIDEAGEDGILAGDLHDAYEERVDDGRSRRQRRNYLAKMESYNLIDVEGSTRWKTYSVVDVPDWS